MVPDELVIEKCTEFKVLEARRYQESCHIYCILNDFLNSERLGKIILIENEPKTVKDNRSVEVDALIEINNGQYNIIELTTSVRDEQDIIKKLKQLEERDDDLVIDTTQFKISHLVLLCHLDDIEKIKDKFEEMVSTNEIHINRPVVFLSWIQQNDKGDTENYYIKYHYGDCTNSSFLEKIKSFSTGLKKGVIDTIMKSTRDRYIFTNKQPYDQYLFVQFKLYIHQRISPILKRPKIEETVNLSTVDEEFKTFSKQFGNNLVKPKSRWFKRAIIYFQKELGWIKIREDNRIEVSNDKFKSRRKGDNDEFKFFSKRLCYKQQKELKKREKAKEKVEKKYGKPQKGLDDFF